MGCYEGVECCYAVVFVLCCVTFAIDDAEAAEHALDGPAAGHLRAVVLLQRLFVYDE